MAGIQYLSFLGWRAMVDLAIGSIVQRFVLMRKVKKYLRFIRNELIIGPLNQKIWIILPGNMGVLAL
jgi:hypothetical protein